MEKETKTKIIEQIARLKLESRMYEFSFKARADKLSEKELNAILDSKLRADRQLAILEKILEESE